MRTTVNYLLFFFAFHTAFGQVAPGISVQGIARDAGKAALVDETLTFIFDIQNSAGGTSYYKEDVDIKTDPYGVFSHIIGTGNKLAGSGNFNEIPFGQTHMKLVITVNYGGTDVVVSNSPFQYTPYAKAAENGVPTGTIVAFAGQEADIPAGWILCDGRALALVAGSLNLRNLIGANAPDLRGMFLRGTGSTANGQTGPALGAIQEDAFESHNHPGTTDLSGNHTHSYSISVGSDSPGGSVLGAEFGNGSGDGVVASGRTSGGGGNHDHIVTTENVGGDETRPVNYGINYIIKL